MSIFGSKRPIFDPTSTPHFSNSYQIEGKSITCQHCGHNKFDQAKILLNTPGMTFFGLDWANRTATVLSCQKCGRIDWYVREPEEVK